MSNNKIVPVTADAAVMAVAVLAVANKAVAVGDGDALTCCTTLSFAAAQAADAAMCCCCCCFCCGCCGKLQSCTEKFVCDRGGDAMGSQPGGERCGMTLMIQLQAGMLVPCTGCLCCWFCCGACAPCAKCMFGEMIKNERRKTPTTAMAMGVPVQQPAMAR